MKKKILIIALLSVVFTFLSASVVFADEPTDFYYDVVEKYKESKDPEPDQVEIFKKYLKQNGFDTYSYESNTVDCSWYDVTCHVTANFIFTNMVGFIKASMDLVSGMVITPAEITQNQFDVYLYMYNFKEIGWMIAAIFLMYQTVKLFTLYMGESDEGMNALHEKIVKVLAVGVLLGIYVNFFEWMMKFEQYAADAILSSAPSGKEIAIAIAVNTPTYGIILSLFAAVIILVFAFAYLYRFALFCLLFITGGIAIPTMLNDQFNFFSIWLRTMVSNIITFTLQTICFAIGFNKLVSLEDRSFFFGIAFFILALTIPAILGQFGASTGSGRAVASGAKRVVMRR